MSKALAQGIGRRIDDVAGGIKVRFADLKMNNVPSLRLQRLRLRQYFERSFSPEACRSLSQTKFVMYGLIHEGHWIGSSFAILCKVVERGSLQISFAKDSADWTISLITLVIFSTHRTVSILLAHFALRCLMGASSR